MPHSSIERQVIVDGVRLWTVSQGSGIPVILCNGGPGCPDYLAPVAELIDDIAQVIRFEERGCGRSDHTPPYNLETTLADLENIRCLYGHDHWIVAGHSWGADLALVYALRHPERTLGFICLSGGRISDDREWYRIYTKRLKQGLETLPDFAYPINPDVNEQEGRPWKEFIHRPALLREIAQCQTPALFVYGDADVRPSWPSEQVAHLLPNARLEILAGADHFIWRTHSRQLRTLLANFIRSVTQ